VVVVVGACCAGGEGALVWRVREMLGLQTEAGMFRITGAGLARRIVKVVSGVKLHSRLGGGNFHETP